MPSTKICMLNLLCEAEIRVRKDNTNQYFSYLLHNKPCFGMFFKGALNLVHRKTVFRDINIDVYQFISPKILDSYRMNNFCSLSPKQLDEYHRELEFVFAKTINNEDSGLKISVTETKRLFNRYRWNTPTNLKAIKIHIEADKLVSYQLLVLLTLIRLSSEYPNAMLLKECCNLQDAGYFKEFSKLSLFMLLSNRLMHIYDQGPLNNFNNQERMCKPICLEFLQTRMTPGTEEYAQTKDYVMNTFPIVDRGPKNRENFKFPIYYSGGGDEYGHGKLYATNEDINTLFKGGILPDHLESFNQLRDMVYGQFPRLKVDHPEFKVVQK